MVAQKLISFYTANPFNRYLVLIFLHFVGDFILQTNYMAKAKDIHYWINLRQENKKKEDRIPIIEHLDWIPVMLAHCLIWSVCVHYMAILSSKQEPIMIALSITMHTVIHFVIDTGRCMRLYQFPMFGDQIAHLIQLLFVVMY